MKIATWNVNSLRVRLPRLLEWLAAIRPDVIALQETKLPDDDFPLAEIEAAGYRAVFAGQKTYNGVATLSREPISDVQRELPDAEDPQRRFLAATCDGVRVINVYVPNGESVGSDKFAYKLDWFDRLTAFVRDELRQHSHLIVLGDFNVAPEERDVHDPKEWKGQVLFSEPERAALQHLIAAGLVDTFRLFDQPERCFSWWDYRMNAFKRNRGLRIDHILASATLGRACTACRIDIEPRRGERPSDHAPVVATFARR
ncbi:MAG TPA: exodeoxyribonuclease III [Candidatus Kryptonia bacterium]|nr:exodeoxyribonuclease III [Candidatus Kryptonia bacterium]